MSWLGRPASMTTAPPGVHGRHPLATGSAVSQGVGQDEFSRDRVVAFTWRLADALGLVGLLTPERLDAVAALVQAEVLARRRVGGRPILADVAPLVVAWLQALRAPSLTPSGGGGGGVPGGPTPGPGGTPGSGASAPAPAPAPGGSAAEVARAMAEQAQRMAAEAAGVGGLAGSRARQQAVDAYNQAVDALTRAQQEANAALDAARGARTRADAIEEAYREWVRQTKAIEKPEMGAEQGRRATEVGDADIEAGRLQEEAKRKAEEAEAAAEAVRRAREAVDAVLGPPSPQPVPTVAGGAGVPGAAVLETSLTGDAYPPDVVSGVGPGPGPPGGASSAEPPTGRGEPTAEPVPSTATGDKPPCCCCPCCGRLLDALTDALAAAHGGDCPCCCPATGFAPGGEPPGVPTPGAPPAGAEPRSPGAGIPPGSPPPEGPSPGGAPPSGSAPGGGAGAPPPQPGPGGRPLPSQPPGGAHGGPLMAAPPVPFLASESPGRGGPAPGGERPPTQLPLAREPTATGGEKPREPSPDSQATYGGFEFLFKSRMYRYGVSFRPRWPGMTDEEFELTYLRAITRSDVPWDRADLLARARVLESILAERGWVLDDDYEGELGRFGIPVWTTTRAGKKRSITSLVWLLTGELHPSYQGSAQRPPRASTAGLPSGGGPLATGLATGPGAREVTTPANGSPRVIAGQGPTAAGDPTGRSGATPLPQPDPSALPDTSDLALTDAQKRTIAEVLATLAGRSPFGIADWPTTPWRTSIEFDPPAWRVPKAMTAADEARLRGAIEAAVLRSMADHPLLWTFGWETLVTATEIATVVLALMAGAELVIAAVPAAYGALAITVLDAVGVVAIVVAAADGIRIIFREDTLSTLVDPSRPIRERTQAYGDSLQAATSLWFLRQLPGPIGRLWTRPHGLPELAAPRDLTPGVRVPRGELGWDTIPPRPGGVPTWPPSPRHSEPRLLPTADELERLRIIESLFGKAVLTEQRTAGYIVAHRMPDTEVARMAYALRRGGWTRAQRSVLLRSGLAGSNATPTLFANLALKYGPVSATQPRVLFVPGTGSSPGRFRWVTGATTTGKPTLGPKLTDAELAEFSLYERLHPVFSAQSGAASVRTPVESDVSRLDRLLQSIQRKVHPGPFATPMYQPKATNPPGAPPYRFNMLPRRGDADPTRGILHGVLNGVGWRFKTPVGSTRSSVTDFLPGDTLNRLLAARGRGARGSGYTEAEAAIGHAEMQAVGFMRMLGIREAWLDINYLGGPCKYCRPVLEYILPEGTKLHVRYVTEDGAAIASQTFEGTWK